MGGYYEREQSIQRLENIKKVLEYYNAYGGTIKEIAQALGMSKSSVQRYLEAAQDPEIKEQLRQNKLNGNSLGGKTTQSQYGYEKDEFGHFRGSRK